MDSTTGGKKHERFQSGITTSSFTWATDLLRRGDSSNRAIHATPHDEVLWLEV